MDVRKLLLIYVVDDNKNYNRMICEYLKKQNYTNIKSFESAMECIKSVTNGDRPHIVIQDYNLKDLNGINVLQNVKKHSKHTEFIFLTANDNLEAAINSIKYGAYDYIIKEKDIALKKVVDKIQKITKIILLKRKNRIIKLSMIISIFVLIIIIIIGLFQVLFNTFGLL